ncbi:hypothetical protein [Desulfosarcina cetonica]|uniref:hypothetical protein n=1 Tax=Desulfosarcina cetonica TaxID=90730 RepID=UPI000B04D03A|nr:hypothetical protein [Desulfosarcina cetonica]
MPLRPPVSHSSSHSVFPFAAIIGQDALKQSLLLNAVNPAIGGVLIRGEKGTAKSTAVRALAAILPEIDVVAGCAYACQPDYPEAFCEDCRRQAGRMKTVKRRVRVVNLPLNATEDRVAGGIDFAWAVRKGRRALQPGLLAAAHRGICMSTRSICWTITSSTLSWTRQPRVRPSSNGRAFPSAIPRGLSWWAP